PKTHPDIYKQIERGGGMGEELYKVISFNYYEEISAIILLIILTVACVDLLSEKLRHAAIGRLEAAR
ncbi:MAG: hypothetical protein ACK5NZ_00855, partial [bacterium]